MTTTKTMVGVEQPLPIAHIFAGGGEMAQRIRTYAWETTPLGPISEWPSYMCTAVRLCLTSHFPTVIFWGPELALLYNDAYLPILANKHPASLGRATREVFAEVWDMIGPMLEGVFTTGEATWSDDLMLPLVHHGVAKEHYFTFSYSPIQDESGQVRGVFCPVTETTERIERERREHALRQEAEAARTHTITTLESITDGFYTLDREWRFAYVNRRATEIWREPHPDVVGKRIWDEFPDAEASAIGEQLHTAMREQVTKVFEGYYAPWDAWMEVHAYPSSEGLAVYFQDITERKRREANAAFLAELQVDFARLSSPEEIMQIASAKMGAFLHISNCLFADIDEAADLTRVQYTWNAAAGMPDVVGTYRLSDYITAEFRQAARAGKAVVINNTQTDPWTDSARYAAMGFQAFVTVPFHYRGEWRYLFTVNDAVPREWRAEEIAVIEEFTNRVFARLERARADEQVRESEAKFATAFQLNPLPMALMTVDGRYVEVNEAAERSLGYTRKELLSRTTDELAVYIYPHQREEFYARLQSEGRVRDFEAIWRSKTGTLRTYLISAEPLTIEGERYVLTVNNDITARKQAEDALAQQAHDLARAHADLRQVSYASAHDLQEPVRQVSIYTQQIAKQYADSLSADARDAIAFIIEGTKRMQAQFTDLMHYLEIEEVGVEITTTDCEVLLQHVLDRLQETIVRSGASVTHEPLPVVRAHATYLQLVFRELLDNALKFHSETPPQIHLWAECREDNWRFAVRDNGIGISQPDMSQLFGFFRKLQRRTDYPGTGMGLAMCKKIIDRHGGRIWIESTPGLGTTVYFTIRETSKPASQST